MAFTPSKYQQDIFNWTINAQPGQNLVVQALAGSGKTTTLEKMIGMLSGNVLFVAFNTSIANELKTRLENVPNANVRTYSVGLNIVSKSLGRVQVDQDTDWKLIKGYLGESARYLQSSGKRLVSMVKNNLTDDTDSTLFDLASHYGIEINGDYRDIFDCTRHCLKMAKQQTSYINFDDMIWLPNVLTPER